MNLPRYRSFKEVGAVKIAKVVLSQPPPFQHATCRGCESLRSNCGHCERCVWARKQEGKPSAYLHAVEPGIDPIPLDREYLSKHQPQPGGYYVEYADGYKSFSPAEAFEGGYVRI